MCFITLEDEQPKIAEKDVECYKIVARDMFPCFIESDGQGRKPPYQLNEVYHATSWRGKRIRNLHYRQNRYQRYYIEEGIHTYQTLNDAIKMSGDMWIENIILKCIIPKGTLYCKNRVEYVSLKIIPQEIIE